MTRNSDSDPASEAHGSLGANGLTSADMDLTGMGENMLSESGSAQKSATSTESRSPASPSPISMAKKKGNQPR